MSLSDPDFENPSEEAPDGADQLIWRLAYGLFRDHRPAGDGTCASCHQHVPCEWRELAMAGFLKAFRWTDGGGLRNPGRY